MLEAVNKLLDRAIEQGKLNSKESAEITTNSQGNTWVTWKNPRRSFKFTVFKDGAIVSGLFGNKL